MRKRLICVTSGFQREFPNAEWMNERSVESYMGLPVMGPAGEVIGMVQIMNRTPISKTKDLRAVLLIFAVRVAAEITRWSAEERLQERERLMREAENACDLGSWEWIIAADRFHLSTGGLGILELEALPDKPDMAWALGTIHPEHREPFRALVDEVIRTKSALSEELRILTSSGKERWVHVRGKVLLGPDGDPLRLAGILLDVTERRQLSETNKAFAKLGHQLAGAATKLEAARTIIAVCAEILEVQAAAFMLRNAQAPESFTAILTVDSVDGVLREFEPPLREAPPTPLQQRTMDEGPQLVLRRDEDPTSANGGPWIPFGNVARRSASILCVPVRDKERCIGFLAVHSYRENAYTPRDSLLLQSLADHAASALLRVDAAEEARKNYELLRTVVDSLPAHVAYAYVDVARCYRMVNHRYEEWFKVPRPSIEGRQIREFLPPSMFQLVSPLIDRAMQGEKVEYEFTTDKVMGVEQHLHVHYVPHLGEGTEVLGMVGLVTDVSKLRRAELQLRESIVHTQSIVDNAPAAVFLKDLQGRFTLVNKRWEQITGVDRKVAIGLTSHDIFPHHVAEMMNRDDQQVLNSRQPLVSETSLERVGNLHVFLVHKAPLIGADSQVYGICAIASEITHLKHVEERLKTTESILEGLQRRSGIGNGPGRGPGTGDSTATV